MKIYCKNTEQGLIPLYDSDLEEKKKLKIGEVYSFEYKKERNYQFHKKFMALCKLGSENSKNVEMPFDAYRKYVTIKAGYFNLYHTPKGAFVEAKSISFGSMDETEFAELYNKVLGFIAEDIQADKHTIENELISFM